MFSAGSQKKQSLKKAGTQLPIQLLDDELIDESIFCVDYVGLGSEARLLAREACRGVP